MRVDSQTVLAGALVLYALFLGVGSANLYAGGLLKTSQSFEVVASAIYIGILALAYLIYHGVYDMSATIGSYEDADIRKTGLWVAIGTVILFVLYLFHSQMPFSSLYAQTVLNLIYIAPIFIALAENMGLIAVVGDYVYDRTRNMFVAATVVGLVAIALHATVPLVVPGFSFAVLFVQFFLWTVASIESRSTLPADIMHVVNNAVFLLGV